MAALTFTVLQTEVYDQTGLDSGDTNNQPFAFKGGSISFSRTFALAGRGPSFSVENPLHLLRTTRPELSPSILEAPP